MQHCPSWKNSRKTIRHSNLSCKIFPYLTKFIACFLLCWISHFTPLFADTKPIKITAACNPTDYNNVSNKQTIAISSTWNPNSGSLSAALDGSENNAFWIQRNFNIANQAVIQFQFPSPTVLTGIESTGSNFLKGGATFKMRASDDGNNWVDVTGSQTFSTSTTAPAYGAPNNSYKFPIAGNNTPYLYYQIYGLSGQTDWNWVDEFYFGVSASNLASMTNLTCNSNGTLFDAVDDYITFDLDPCGAADGATYNVSVSSGTITPSSGTFGSPTNFRLQDGSAGAGDVTLTVSGFDDAMNVIETITDPGACLPGPCTATDYNIQSNKSGVIMSTTHSTGGAGSPANLVDGVNANNFYYGNNSNISGNEIVRMQFPSATRLTGFEIECSGDFINGGAVVSVQGSNDGSTWTEINQQTRTGTATQGQYGSSGLVEGFPIPENGSAYIYYRVLGVSGTTRSFNWVWEIFFESGPNIGMTNLICNNGGTPGDGADDFLTFDLNPGPGTGTYTVSAVGHSISPTTGTFGQATSFTLPAGSAGNGDITINIIDASTPCTIDGVIKDPGFCFPGPCEGPDYNLTANKQNITLTTTASVSGSINVLKDGNNSNNSFFYTQSNQNVAGKDYIRMQFPSATVLQGFEIVVGGWLFSNGTVMKVQASNDGTNWTDLLTKTHTQAQPNCIYGSCNIAEIYEFPNNGDAYVYYRLFGVSGSSRLTPWINELYFKNGPLAGISNIAYNRNGTDANLLDDYYTFDLAPISSTSGTYEVSSTGAAVSPTMGTFGTTTSFSFPPGSAGDTIPIVVYDPTANCIAPVDVFARLPEFTVVYNDITCNGAVANSDASIILESVLDLPVRIGYSEGFVYTGDTYNSATPVGSLPMTLASGLENPAFNTAYTVRGYYSETNFRDYTLIANKIVCARAALSVAMSPVDGNSAYEGETLDYTVTLTNAGPDPGVDVQVRVDVPTGTDFVSAKATNGTYSSGTEVWTIDQVPVGSETLTITYRLK
ncbi:MAG: hypothetical protein AAF960_08015 [Bacteroidota bacterium]